MNLLVVMLLAAAAGVGSVVFAAGALRFGLDGERGFQASSLLSIAAGVLLGTAFTHLLPEAFEDAASAAALCTTLLGAIVFFFLTDKAELLHHHHRHAAGEPAGAGAAAHPAGTGAGANTGTGGLAILVADGLHCFGDGAVIASAWMADSTLGLITAAAIMAHEIPHHVGDLIVLRGSVAGRQAAATKLATAGAMTIAGGAAGFLLLDRLHWLMPYLLVVASGSFIYVALADLVPQLQQRLTARQTVRQVLWLLCGIVAIAGISRLEPEEHHEHANALPQHVARAQG